MIGIVVSEAETPMTGANTHSWLNLIQFVHLESLSGLSF